MMYPIHHRMDILMRHAHNGEALKWRCQYLNDFLEEYNKLDGALLRENYIIARLVTYAAGPHITVGIDGARRRRPAGHIPDETYRRMWRYLQKRIAEDGWTVEAVWRESRR